VLRGEDYSFSADLYSFGVVAATRVTVILT
jgi:hypothetical protein